MSRDSWLGGPWYRPRGLLTLFVTGMAVTWLLGLLMDRETTARNAAVTAQAARRATEVEWARAVADSLVRHTPVAAVPSLSDTQLDLAVTSGSPTADSTVYAAMQAERDRRKAASAAEDRRNALQGLRARADAYRFSSGERCTRASNERLRRLFDAHEDWTVETVVQVACGAVWIGQTAEQLRASWGKPEQVNRTVHAYGTKEQWVYGGRNYVYLDDGVVASWQN